MKDRRLIQDAGQFYRRPFRRGRLAHPIESIEARKDDLFPALQCLGLEAQLKGSVKVQ